MQRRFNSIQFVSLYKLKHIYSVEAIECPSIADWFMQKCVALIVPQSNVVLSYCIIHWCLVKEWRCATLNLNAIVASNK